MDYKTELQEDKIIIIRLNKNIVENLKFIIYQIRLSFSNISSISL